MTTNLFKLIFIITISIIHVLSLQAQPPGDPNPDTVADLAPVDDSQECLDKISLYGSYNDNRRGYPGLFVIADCPNSSQFFLTLPECAGCDSPYEVSFNGKAIKLIRNNAVVIPDFFNQYSSGQYSFKLELEHMSERTGILKIGFDCDLFGPGTSKSFEFKIISEGAKFDIPVLSETPRTVCNVLDPVETTSICNCGKLESVDELSITVNTSYSTVVENEPIVITFTGVISPKNSPVSFEISTDIPLGNTTYSNSSSTGKTFSSTFSSNSLPIGKCITPCYKVCHLIRKYETLVANCDVEDYSLGISEKMVPGSETLKFVACNPPGLYDASENVCPSLLFKLKAKPRLYASEMACLGSIEAEILSGSADLNYYWTGPNGFSSKATTLENVPAGQYTLTLTDECCNSVTETYFLCSDALQVSGWIFNFQSQEWCAEFNCGEPAGSRSSCSMTRCVKADRTEVFFENGFCKERHFFEGAELGVAEENTKEAFRVVEYDASSRNCIYKFYCENDEVNPVEVKEEWPTSTQWHYDESYNKCFLDVVCEDVDFQNVEEVDPDITYRWDDINSECVADFILCDDNEINHMITTYPDLFGSWEFATFPNYCYRTVICDNGDELVDYGEYSEILIPNPNPNPNCPYTSLIEVYCDGRYVETIDPCEEVNNHKIETRGAKESVSFEKFDKGILVKFTNPSEKRIMQINNIDAKIILSKPIEKFANEIYLDTSEFPSGMYIINIRNQNVDEGNYKFIIMN